VIKPIFRRETAALRTREPAPGAAFISRRPARML
jgi:hypothetical protein